MPTTSHIQELIPPPDPVRACERLAGLPERLFLDSARGGRHSYLMADPWEVIRDPAALRRHMEAVAAADGLHGDVPSVLPPFRGGAAGLVEYDWEPSSREGFRFGLYDWVIAWDHEQGRAWLISTGQPGTTAEARALRARARAAEVLHLLQAPLPAPPPPPARPAATAPVSNFTQARYEAAVEEVLRHIETGGVEQVNLSQRFEASRLADPWHLYLHLRSINPAPFAAFHDLGERQILSASPERFFSVREGWVELAPIKGTRPRGRDEREDRALAEELVGSEKDRRENEMISALVLRELEPFCEQGSARVRESCRLERHPTVQHLVSTVEGRLARGRDPLHLLEGIFPPLSIAGKPRRRALELIAAIEGAPRGPYCGSLAWWSYTRSFDSSVLIRSIVVEGERLHFSAGGGIVRGSSPTQEWEESMHKARSMLEAIGGKDDRSER